MKKNLNPGMIMAFVLAVTFSMPTQVVSAQVNYAKSSDDWFYSTTSEYKVNNKKVNFKENTYPVFVGFNKYLPVRTMCTEMGGVLDTSQFSKGLIYYVSYDRDVTFNTAKNTITVKPRLEEEYTINDVSFYSIKGTLYVDVRSFNLAFPYNSSVEPNYVVPTEEDYEQAKSDDAARQAAIDKYNGVGDSYTSTDNSINRQFFQDDAMQIKNDGKSILVMGNEEQIKSVILADINSARSKEGLSTLTLNSNLSKAAQTKTDAMASGGKYEHEGDYGDLLSQVYNAGVTKGNFKGVSENLGKDPWYEDGAERGSTQVTSWMLSEGHKTNIMRSNNTDIGIGVTVSNDGTIYYSVFFGRK